MLLDCFLLTSTLTGDLQLVSFTANAATAHSALDNIDLKGAVHPKINL